VMMRSQHYRAYTLADLEWLLVPPMLPIASAFSRLQLGGGYGRTRRRGFLAPPVSVAESQPKTISYVTGS
jgi:hypothetical protein